MTDGILNDRRTTDRLDDRRRAIQTGGQAKHFFFRRGQGQGEWAREREPKTYQSSEKKKKDSFTHL